MVGKPYTQGLVHKINEHGENTLYAQANLPSILLVLAVALAIIIQADILI